MDELEIVKEYRRVTLTRQPGEYIEIGYSNGSIISFYEHYSFASNYIQSYVGADVNAVVNQLKSFEWRVS